MLSAAELGEFSSQLGDLQLGVPASRHFSDRTADQILMGRTPRGGSVRG
jgi:hypothetical protein